MIEVYDAPWLGAPDEPDEPYDNAGEESFLGAADEWFGWRILAWHLGIDEQDVPEPDDFQQVWLELPKSIRNRKCGTYRKSKYKKARELYNNYIRRQKNDCD